MYKKAFSMLMTLIVIVIFSLIVVLGLKMSSLQLESKKLSLPYFEALNVADSIYPLIKIILTNTKICKNNINIDYDKYHTSSNIIYSPWCYKSSIGNVTMKIVINMQIFDIQNNINHTKVFYDKI
jgi:hypothetical protein